MFLEKIKVNYPKQIVFNHFQKILEELTISNGWKKREMIRII